MLLNSATLPLISTCTNVTLQFLVIIISRINQKEFEVYPGFALATTEL